VSDTTHVDIVVEKAHGNGIVHKFNLFEMSSIVVASCSSVNRLLAVLVLLSSLNKYEK